MASECIEHERPVLLDVRSIGISFGGLRAVSDFTLQLREGSLIGLIGPNGAGKTTVFNMLTGIYRPSEGEILLNGENLVGKPPHEYARKGIARTFQNIRLFGDLTVLDNIKIARHPHINYGLLPAMVRSRDVGEAEQQIEVECLQLLDKLNLLNYAATPARNLPYGVQRRVEIGRALAASPRILLLDEPAAGMNPQEIDELAERIRWIRREFGVTILLIEHHMRLVMQICERIKVMNFGETIAEGTPEEIKRNPAVVQAYLGEGGKY